VAALDLLPDVPARFDERLQRARADMSSPPGIKQFRLAGTAQGSQPIDRSRRHPANISVDGSINKDGAKTP
jgi:hypothetical protein